MCRTAARHMAPLKNRLRAATILPPSALCRMRPNVCRRRCARSGWRCRSYFCVPERDAMKRRIAVRVLAACIGLWFAQTVPAVEEVFAPEGPGLWLPITAGGPPGPTGPGTHLLPKPSDGAFSLPSSSSGNKVRWVEALQEGYIEPRPSILDDDYQMQVLDLDVLRTRTAGIPMVLFPQDRKSTRLNSSHCS